MDDIEIFTAPGCGYCESAKALRKTHGLAFKERDVADAAVLAEFRRRPPRARAVPQIFLDGEHIGGYVDLNLRLSS